MQPRKRTCPMLPRHLQNLGRTWVAHAEYPPSFYRSRHMFGCPWWAGQQPWPPYPHFNSWHPPVIWRPHHFCGPSRTRYQGPPCNPWNAPPSSWVHFSNVNMSSKGEEPMPKRMKCTEEDVLGRKPSPNRSYSPTNDFRVPPLHEASDFPIPDHDGVKASTRGKIKRRWEDFGHDFSEMSKVLVNRENQHANTHAPENFDFTVMSYNILSQDLLEDNCHLYKHCRRPLLFWSYRLTNILQELKQLDADILCLQEVQEDHYRTQIKPSLEALGYHCEYKNSTGENQMLCHLLQVFQVSLMSVKPGNITGTI
ncbi:hypothetical protein FKM82_026473 [Ascaphus truei]